MDIEAAPCIKCSVSVNEKLQVSAFVGSVKLKSFNSEKFPIPIPDIHKLFNIMDYMKSLSNCQSSNVVVEICSVIRELLETLQLYLQEEESVIQFITEEVGLLSSKKAKLRYSPQTLIVATLIYSISPHAYKFLRSSGILIIPHPTTLRKPSSEFHANPSYEQFECNFLKYAKEKCKGLEKHEKTVTLMMDEIHIKPYFDYKGGNVVGMAFNNDKAASNAHVFMIQSMLSSYKDVVHILPVKTMSADILHSIIKKVIMGLEEIGFSVIGVVSDNNSINRKAMSFFSNPPKLSIAYPHPVQDNRPLFFVIDSVHLLKCIRNNWLNQRNLGQCMFYPNFETFPNNLEVNTASFITLKKLHEIEQGSLVKFGYGLTLKALTPSNLERQNVKLALKVFNEFVIKALGELGEKHSLEKYKETANYIEIIYRWWCVVNVKTSSKGIRLRNVLMHPLTLMPNDERNEFLNRFLSWLDAWSNSGCTTGVLTKETHLALTHTTHALLEMARYCIEELNMKYFLCGKVQTDLLEERFGKYRMLSGSQYHVSIRQVFESESKLRLQDSLPLTVKSSTFGKISVDKFDAEKCWDDMGQSTNSSPVEITLLESDLSDMESIMPVLTYLAGYCVFSVCKRLNCESGKSQMTVDKEMDCDSSYRLIQNLDRGGLKFPHPDVVNIIMHCYAVAQKLLSFEHESTFLKVGNQRHLLTNVTYNILSTNELFNSIDVCSSGHYAEDIVKQLLWVSANVLLKKLLLQKK